ncbi:ras-related and estrogen-regulated growth inhibitor-like isoform X1 [Hirundo rustica]|uniref:ras-related and estrogen-regulated growth inhibitor-like isoform X1 n=1 Tax=Hirundo rustica TaxID=43150 RepID=UPI00267237DA|nr:ras-related and estrogen-regulated growth inhibitor-like isoform X1 [Hirundo rustica]
MAAAFGKGTESLMWAFEGSTPLARSLLPASFFLQHLCHLESASHGSEVFWGPMERVEMPLKVFPGLSLLPRMPKAHPALTVRFITRRFIGDYDPTLEMIYRHVAVIDGEMVHFEILDTAGQEEDSLQIEEKIKWGDGFAVVYSVTDRCSFDEVMRLCFLINHLHASPKRSGAAEQPPVVIVGNKKDLQFDRMVSTEDGENLSKALKIPFYEISTRDSYEEPVAVFGSLYQELLRQGHFSPGSFKRRTVSKLMEKIPKMQASSTLNSTGRSLSFNSFRDYIPE